MNIENDFLTDFDLFGKVPELYYKGRSKKSSTFGIILTVIYIALYIAFLLYKLIRMFKRVDMTFYDSYTFQGLPSINLTNNEFYGGFGMGGIIDERMYYLTVDYVSQVRVDGNWVINRKRLDTEICQLEWFGSEYQEIFSKFPIQNYYCIKDVSGMVMEGYSNLERYSYFNVRFFPCVGVTKDGIPCYDYNTKKQFFTQNVIELKIQDNYINPEDYENPVIRREVDMNSPVFMDLFQLIYSYIQIVNIETDEDITGLNFFTDHIRKQMYTRYDESFLIASPLFYGDILRTGGPIADATLQLAAKVLTEKRQYLQLIDVLGDVGGLMEILYSFLNVISSFITEILYDRSLVNNLFSFDINKKFVALNSSRSKHRQSKEYRNSRDLRNLDALNLKQKLEDLDNNKNIEDLSKENSGDQNIVIKNTISTNRKKEYRNPKNQKNATSKTNHTQSKEKKIQHENLQDYENKLSMDENKLSVDENKNIISIYNVGHEHERSDNETVIAREGKLRNIYINNFLIFCFWCSSRKRNINKILFEEGSKLITRKLDIMNMFINIHIVELMKLKLGIEPKGMEMSSRCKKNLKIYYENNTYDDIERSNDSN